MSRTAKPPREHPWKRITAVTAAVAGVLAVLASATSLFDWFEDRVSPEPAAAPRAIDARIEGVALKNLHRPLGDYLEATGQSLEGLSPVERREEGLEFTVRVRLRGGVGETYPLLWTMYDIRRGAAVSDELYEQEAATFTPAAATHARAWPVWVPYPPDPGRYRLDLVLVDKKRQPVDERSSRAFSIETIPALD